MRKFLLAVSPCCFLLLVMVTLTVAQEELLTLTEVNLVAGQDTNVGGVIVEYDKEEGCLYVTYDVTGGTWYLTETHLQVATSLEGIPQTKKGNPIPGQFDYKMEHEPSAQVQEYTITVQLGDVGAEPGDTLYIAAHAVVETVVYDEEGNPVLDEDGNPIVINETAWGAGEPFDGKNWATYFTCTIPEPGEQGE